jgi:hypothetical protein
VKILDLTSFEVPQALWANIIRYFIDLIMRDYCKDSLLIKTRSGQIKVTAVRKVYNPLKSLLNP